MNIALFLDCFIPMKNGVITSALQLKEGLEKKGHHVVVVAVKVKGYKSNDPNILLFPQISLDFGSKQGFGLGLVNQKKLNKFLKEHKIDIIHTHTEFGIGFGGRKAALKLKIPRVTTTHTMWEQYTNYSPLLGIKPLFRGFFKLYIKGTSVIVAPSIKAKKHYETIVPEIPFQIVPNGIDVKKFKSIPTTKKDIENIKLQYGLKKEDKILIFVGRIGPEKRVGALMDSVIPLCKKDKNIKLVYVGDGPDMETLKKKASSVNLEKNFIFTGFVDWEQVHKLYSISNIFVTASLSEVHPMTLIEGAMCGLPLIARKDYSYLDLIENKKNGYLVNTDEEMTRKIEELIYNKTKLKSFSKASLEISKKFTAENHVNRMEKLYKKVIAYYPDNIEKLRNPHLLD